MTFEQRFLHFNEKILERLERDYVRSASVTEERAVTRVQFRSRGWLPWTLIGGGLLVMGFLKLAAGYMDGISFLGALERTWSLFPLALVAIAIAASVVFAEQGLLISPSDITIVRGVFPLRRVTRIPLSRVRSVRTGFFRFANWDRYVAVETDQRTIRVAWGLSHAECEEVAGTIRNRLKGLPNSA